MAHPDQTDTSVPRRPKPDAAAQDARNAASPERAHADTEASREAVALNRATTPNEVSEETVAEIAAAAEARARR